jgi:hypothetical protein
MELASSRNACLDLPTLLHCAPASVGWQFLGGLRSSFHLTGPLAGHLPDGRRASSRPSPAVATQCFGSARKRPPPASKR